MFLYRAVLNFVSFFQSLLSAFLFNFPCLSAAVLDLFHGVIEYLRFLAFGRFVFDLISALNMCSVGSFEDFTDAAW